MFSKELAEMDRNTVQLIRADCRNKKTNHTIEERMKKLEWLENR